MMVVCGWWLVTGSGAIDWAWILGYHSAPLITHRAEVAELADARDSKSRDRKVMGVRPPPSALPEVVDYKYVGRSGTGSPSLFSSSDLFLSHKVATPVTDIFVEDIALPRETRGISTPGIDKNSNSRCSIRS